MNREILFKGKRLDNKEWIQGGLITGVFTRLGQDIPYILCPEKADYDCFEDFSEENGIFEVYPETVCQYTGLNDKNGRKIFEGDIVKYDFGEEQIGVQLAVVQYDAQYHGFLTKPVNDWMYAQLKDCEVIGNIFDNPELLDKAGELNGES